MNTSYIQQYRTEGIGCFPLIPGDKVPAVQEWQFTAPDTYGDAALTGNYGAALTPTLMVLDSDPRNYPPDRDMLAELEVLIGPLPETFTVQTPGGGHHRYFRKPADIPIRKKVREYRGLDFLSQGSFAVGPGSNVGGKDYAVVQGHLNQLANAPVALLDLIVKPATKRRQTNTRQKVSDRPLSRWMDHGSFIQWFTEYLKVCDPAEQGQNGNDTTYKVACQGWSQGLSQNVVLQLMLDIYNPRCVPPWPEDELAIIVSNAFQYADGPHGQAAEDIMDRLITDVTLMELPPSPLENKGFPRWALPLSLQEPIAAIERLTQAPVAIATQSVLAVASLLVQGQVSIKLPFSHQTSPCSLYFLTVAESGERKSSVDKLVQAGILEWEKNQNDAYRLEYAEYKQRHDIWEKLRANVLKSKQPPSIDIVAKNLEAIGPEPVAPLLRYKTCQEPSFEALCDLLEKGQPSMGLFNDEGGGMIGGYAMRDNNKLRTLTGLSHGWDAKPITLNRKGDGHRWLNGKRLSLHLMMQPIVANQLLADELSDGQGFLARCLVSWPESTMGTRWMQDPDPADQRIIEQFQAQVLEWLNQKLLLREGTRNELEPRTVTLSTEAVAIYRDFYNAVEGELNATGKYRCISGFGNKISENAARLATVMATFENPDVEVLSAADMQRGVALGWYYLDQALRIHQRYKRKPPQDPNLAILTRWLTERWSEPYVTPSDVQRYCPNVTVKKLSTNAINELLTCLVQSGLLVEHSKGVQIKGQKRAKYVYRLVVQQESLAH
jgi:Protein of unknown function (DUF3987)/Bifunctional DNA primase/polymerase, N-terminal